MEYLFIILFIYASYLSIEKYVHTGSIFTWRGRKDRKERRATPVTIHPAASSSETEIIGKSRYQIRQSLTIDDNSGQPESGIEKSDTFTPEKKTEPVLRVREPLDKNTKFPEVPAPFQKLNYPEIDYMREASPSSGEEKEEIPERYEITGYVQRSNPHRATGVTFDDMDMIEKAMASDELTEAEQEQARQTFPRLLTLSNPCSRISRSFADAFSILLRRCRAETGSEASPSSHSTGGRRPCPSPPRPT